MDKQFIIICLEDTGLDGDFPKYIQPTRRRFLTKELAEQRMAVIAPTRFAVAVEVEGTEIDEEGYPLKYKGPWMHLC